MRDRRTRVEAAGAVDAQNAPTSSLENAQNAFSTAPTRLIKLLPMSSDECVTYVSGCPGFVIRQVHLQHGHLLIDRFGQADVLGQLVHRADPPTRQPADASTVLIVNV